MGLFNVPQSCDLGCKEFPVPISKSMLLPLASTEAIDNGLHITDEANGLDITQTYGDSDITVTIKDNRTGDTESFRYVDGVLDMSPSEDASGVEQVSIEENSAESTVKNVRGFSKKTKPTNIKGFSKKTKPTNIKGFSKKVNKYSFYTKQR